MSILKNPYVVIQQTSKAVQIIITFFSVNLSFLFVCLLQTLNLSFLFLLTFVLAGGVFEGFSTQVLFQ